MSEVRERENSVHYAPGVVRRRARCSSRCGRGSWTVYEADAYPHRVFGLGAVVIAVATVVVGGATLTAAGRRVGGSRDSVRRWLGWVGNLADPVALQRACAQLCPRGLPGALALVGMARAGIVLHLLDRLADLLEERGVRLPDVGAAGLVRILVHELRRFGDVYRLTLPSPPLRAGLEGVHL